MILLAFLIRGALGALAVIAAQLVLAMVIRSFAVPIFLGLVGGIIGLLAGSKGLSLFWPYALMQAGMNANKSNDVLAGGGYILFFSAVFLAGNNVSTCWNVSEKRDIRHKVVS